MAFMDILPDPLYKRSYWGKQDGTGDQPGPGFASVSVTSDQQMMLTRTNSQRVISRASAGHKWKIDINYNPMTREEFEPVSSFLHMQRGPLTPFKVSLPQYRSPRNSAFSTNNYKNNFQVDGSHPAGRQYLNMNNTENGYVLTDADGATVTNTTKIPTNIPAEGDALTITDSNNSNHTKTYLVTYVETYYVYHSTRPFSERTLRVGIHPPLTKTVSNNADIVFSPVLFKVIKPNAVSTYSLGTDNLFKFKLQLEEYL